MNDMYPVIRSSWHGLPTWTDFLRMKELKALVSDMNKSDYCTSVSELMWRREADKLKHLFRL